jgi:hypothetical protein
VATCFDIRISSSGQLGDIMRQLGNNNHNILFKEHTEMLSYKIIDANQTKSINQSLNTKRKLLKRSANIKFKNN